MKLNKIVFASIVALTVMGCQENETIQHAGALETLEIVTPTHMDTRTALDTNGVSVKWTEGDAIAVYDYSTPKRSFTAEITEGTTRFKGKITPRQSNFIAVYPYEHAAENMTEQKVVLHLPQEQTAVKGSFGEELNLSVAAGVRNIDGSPSQIRFRNVCQLFKLTVPQYADGRIAKIVFSTAKDIAGELVVGFASNNPQIGTENLSGKQIILLPPAGNAAFEEGTYYMVLAPVAVEGFTLTLTDTQGKAYSQRSSATLGGNRGVICNLGNVDLVDAPVATPHHVYIDGVLHGTSVSLTAPVPGKAWSAVIKNAQGTTVRTLASAEGTLVSDHTDQAWPYLPKGAYTVEYTFTTANNKQKTSTTSFSITEDPQFGLTFNAASSYTYYLGDGVAKDVAKANSMDAHNVTGIVCNATGILPSVLGNENYGFDLTNTFGGTISSTSENQANFADITIANLGQSTLSASLTFDGVTKTASKSVYITGLPFTHKPPTSSLWSKDGDVKYESNYVRIGNAGGDGEITYNGVSIPANTKLQLGYHFYIYEEIGVTYTINIGAQKAHSETLDESWQNTEQTYEGTAYITTNALATYVKCISDYGLAQSHSKTYKIALSYGN